MEKQNLSDHVDIYDKELVDAGTFFWNLKIGFVSLCLAK